MINLKILSFNLLCVFASLNVLAQYKLTGRVISATDSSPLYGVSVEGVGISLTAMPNSEGYFVIYTKAQRYTLKFSHVGYVTKRLTVNALDTKQLLVVLEPLSQHLEEVNIVSSGYQKLPKERLTGSFSTIGTKKFNEQVGVTVLSRLEGVANGLFTDRTTSASGLLMVRGLGTIRGPKGPLIVLDNFPYEGNLDNLNPNDVESVTILKDAAASSIWGARAGNGVIVITTKKSNFNEAVKIDFNINATIIAKPDLFYIKQMSSPDFIEVEEFLFSKGKYTAEFNAANKPGQTPIVELLLQKQNNQLSQASYDAAKLQFSAIDIRNEYNKYMYAAGLNQQYALNIKGGEKKHKWNISTGYDRNYSTLNDRYNRFTAHLKHSYQPVKDLDLSVGLLYTQSRNTSGRPGYGSILSRSVLYPYARFADDFGNPLSIMKLYRTGYIETAGNGKLLDWKYYPLEDYKHMSNIQSLSDILINAGATYQIFKGFSADLKYQYERQYTDIKNLRDEQSFFARDLINQYTQLPVGQPIKYIIPKGGILDLSNAFMESNNLRGQLNYNNSWNGHEINFIAGAERREAKSNVEQNRTYGYNGEILTYGNVDYLTTYPSFITGASGYIEDGRSFQKNANRFVSTFANGSYTYDGKYTVSASARRDASNLFGLDTNDQWNPFWSAGLSWDLSKESFLENNVFSYLRLRATYGFSGNIDQSMTAVTTIRYAGTSIHTPAPYAVFNNYYNPALKWERLGMLNIGVDFTTKNSRLTGSIEYFHKKGTDLFGYAEIDYTGGIGSTILKNAASTKGNGIDLELNSSNLTIQEFRWSTNLNLSYFRDIVVSYLNNSQSVSAVLTNNAAITGVVGNPAYGIYSYKWGGLDHLTGNPQGYLNGELSTNYSKLTGSNITYNDLNYHGSAVPTFYGSLGNTLIYKDFSLSARFMFKMGYYFRKRTILYNDLFSSGRGHADYRNRWQHPGDELNTDIPSMIYPGTNARDNFYKGSEVLVRKGDHIRLQYINFAYQMNKDKYKFLPVKSISLYANIANVGLIWTANKEKTDPDYLGENALKPSRTFSLGIRADMN